MHLSTRMTRTVAAALSVAALAAVGAGSASASVDPVGPLNNGEVGYGNGFANGLVTGSANLEWNESGNFTTPRLEAPGNIYIENSLIETRMQIVHHADANHPLNDPNAVTRNGGSKLGSGRLSGRQADRAGRREQHLRQRARQSPEEDRRPPGPRSPRASRPWVTRNPLGEPLRRRGLFAVQERRRRCLSFSALSWRSPIARMAAKAIRPVTRAGKTTTQMKRLTSVTDSALVSAKRTRRARRAS